jgi:SNF2 family DNA or RNA helicase
MIIAPLSTLTNWALEFRRWAPALDVIVYKGTKEVCVCVCVCVCV